MSGTGDAGARAGVEAATGAAAADAAGATIFVDLLAEAPVPARGILSQTLSNEGGVELVLFAFAAGEQLSEHTSARPTIVHILSGEADITVGTRSVSGSAGTWVRMPARLAHSVVARTPLRMALYLLPAD
jgi:quercetin dioxygenase-like cupin family protein